MINDPQLSSHGVDKIEKQKDALQHAISVEEGHGTSEDLGRFHRSFTPRQVHVSPTHPLHVHWIPD